MTTDEFINYIADKSVILIDGEIMKCDTWLDLDYVLRDSLKADVFHYYHYNRQQKKLVHIKYRVV